jgi:hypothetical protein
MVTHMLYEIIFPLYNPTWKHTFSVTIEIREFLGHKWLI